ncbi:ORC-CDC6 family AAA ATPase, partial [Pseudomonas aeruginosa]|uniref:ORC-CDC6 family AAA ATPase n=1 Tax=Pseudomonas aeruginosa TaxID=287 RepID=UPI003F583354
MTGSDKLSLESVDLGAPAAERDIHKGLQHYFIQSEAFRRVSNRSKTVVLGNRGSGKSAIFQMLAKQARERN